MRAEEILASLDWEFADQTIYFRVRRLGKVSVALLIVQILGGTLLPYFFKAELNGFGPESSDKV